MDTINSDGVQSLDSDMFAEWEYYEGSVSTDEEDDADEPYSENRALSGNADYAAKRKRRVSNKRDSVKKQYQLQQNVDATPLWGNRPLSVVLGKPGCAGSTASTFFSRQPNLTLARPGAASCSQPLQQQDHPVATSPSSDRLN
ncbi:hypothetical protein MP228_004901 [Amoeboaphelidium protococcarum]|nr:hypothetical protein MP228_004901 [Amoeboaphelidium protococcarum]